MKGLANMGTAKCILGMFLKFPTCHTQASVAVPIALKSFLLVRTNITK